MKENLKGIQEATSFETSIEIIQKSLCDIGMFALGMELSKGIGLNRNALMIPVLNGGKKVGDYLSRFTGIGTIAMQMSYYDEENKRRVTPICKLKPDIEKIVSNGGTRDIYFAEGVVESEGTIRESMAIINKMIDEKNSSEGTKFNYPTYHTYALISKINGSPKIPNLVNAFWISPEIWVHGWGVDNAEKGRDLESIWGVISPYAKKVPERPYFRPTNVFEKHFKTALFSR